MKNKIKKDAPSNKHYEWFLLAGFFSFVLAIMLKHEMWRDELQAWMLAKASHSLPQLFHIMQFERHPRLWHSCLFVISRFTGDPRAMQVFHLSIAVTTIFVFLKYSPFSKWIKALFVFGYFPLYEYAVISRNYAFGILFVVIFMALYPRRKQHYFLLAIVLFLMAQTNAFGLLFSICFAVILIAEPLFDGTFSMLTVRNRWLIIPAIIVFILAVFFSLLQIKSPAVGLNTLAEIKFKPFVLALSFETIWKSYVPISDFSSHFWNTNLIGSGVVRSFLSLVLLAGAVAMFLKKPMVLFFYVIGTLGALAIIYQYHVFKYVRHFGHLFIFFIVALWLSYSWPERKLKSRLLQRLADFGTRIYKPFVVIILLLQVVAGLSAGALDWMHPFSASRQTARYIRQRNLNGLSMVGDLAEPASAVCGYLGGKMYYPRRKQYGSYIIYNEPDKNIRTRQVMQKALSISKQRKEDILLVLNWKPHEGEYPLKKLGDFTQSIVKDEQFHLYLLKYLSRNLILPIKKGQNN
ncbi:MAG: hypothetical protein GXO75_02215 [Calditrichaeota bacterium]|nr:hypothetical protein [Calditrichota bacterium]